MATHTILLTLLGFLVSVQQSTQHGSFHIDPDEQPENTLRRSDFTRNKEHLKQHLKDIDFDPDKTPPEELDFHFFKVHDLNGDHSLDGLELLQSIMHAVEDHLEAKGKYSAENMDRTEFKDNIRKHLTAIVDRILVEDDADKNGYINYAEFVQTRRASEVLGQITLNI